MNRNVPISYIKLLSNWYGKLFSSVRWEKEISYSFSICAGVRQGGILSPVLFAIFVDSVLDKLSVCKLGCHLRSVCVNSFTYADDLILLAISLCDLQRMINICVTEFDGIGLSINSNKSACIRIGPRHSAEVDLLVIKNALVSWKKELPYLGINILGGKHFQVKFQKTKQKYYRALNSIIGKVGLNSQPLVLLSLIQSCCIPILLHGAEAVNWTNKMSDSIDNAYSNAYMKIFHTFNKGIIKSCQFNFGHLPMMCEIGVRRLNFLTKLTKFKTNVII